MAQTELDDHSEPKYRNEEWLRQKYVGKGLTGEEIGELCGVSARCILDWMERYGIERRDRSEAQLNEGPYMDEEWLREKYIDEGLSTYKIADLCDVSQRTIMNWLEHFDIPTEDVGPRSGRGNQSWVEYAGFSTNNYGYEVSYSSWGGEEDWFVIHRLSAVAWFGWDAVVEREVHHRIPIKWLNVEPNLHPLPKQEHMIISGKYKSDGVPGEVVHDVLEKLG